jgi:uncharacterized protein (DUF58 family)
MRTSLLAGLTTRGTSFLAAGAAAIVAGLSLGERALVSVGLILLVLPLLAAIAARRARYRLSCERTISPARVQAGQTAQVQLRLENVSQLSTGLMLAEDTVPYALGARPRYVLDQIERSGLRELSYPLRSDLRGKFEIGPLEVKLADAFGLVELSRSFSAKSTFVVTPRVVPLSHSVLSRSWAGEGEGITRAAATAGDDDVIPREYRDGDELRRVHWRSTARYGQLMVRREEQRWRNRATVFLDTRRSSHSGSGPSSSFEMAVSAAASIGMHLAKEGLSGQLVTDAGAVRSAGMFEDILLETMATVRLSAGRDLSKCVSALKSSSGLIVVIAGRLSATAAQQLAACRRDGSQAIAVLLAVSTWAEPGQPSLGAAEDGEPVNGAEKKNGRPVSVRHAETEPAAKVLRGAGWRVTTLDASTPLGTAWRLLGQGRELRIPAGLSTDSEGRMR